MATPGQGAGRAGTGCVECVINVSEGRDVDLLNRLAVAAGPTLLDLHRDSDHNRSVMTLGGDTESVAEGARALATAVTGALDLRHHAGAHPRFGALDVVPFVPYAPHADPPSDLSGAVALRDAFAHWVGTVLGVPAFLYGPLPGGGHRTLPELRRAVAEGAVAPDAGPHRCDPRTGVTAVGARRVLVAYNVWVSSVEVAQKVAPLVRSPHVRALGLAVGSRAQVSCNLVDPAVRGPAEVYDAVDTLARRAGGAAEGGELVGLVPEVVLAAVLRPRWEQLGLSADATVEARLAGARPG